MNAYEIMLEVDGLAVVRTEWAHSAMDAFQMAFINAQADSGGQAKSIRVTHIGPPLAEVLRAQAALAKQIEAIMGKA